jgi:segregation and condensation protein B
LKSAINPKPVTDAEMGLPLEEGEGASPNFEPVSVEQESPAADTTTSFTPASEPEGTAEATPSSA